jgi:hypothetical protein
MTTMSLFLNSASSQTCSLMPTPNEIAVNVVSSHTHSGIYYFVQYIGRLEKEPRDENQRSNRLS